MRARELRRKIVSLCGPSTLLMTLLAGCAPEDAATDPEKLARAPLPSAARAPVSSDDLLLVYVHGFAMVGYLEKGVFGEETAGGGTGSNLEALAQLLGMRLGSEDPSAPFALSATEYYGTEYPDYYTEADKQELEAVTREYDGGIPRYALIVARFARHRLEQTGASQLALYGHSMGGAITRWIIEHDLEGLVSDGYINRWIAASGVIQGAMTTAWIPDFMANHFFSRSPLIADEVVQMRNEWIDEQYGGDGGLLDNPLLSGVMVTHIRGTDPDLGPINMYPFFFGNANDTVIAVRDMTFREVTDASKWVDLDGVPVGPAVMEVSEVHTDNWDTWTTMAGIGATLTGQRRVTLTLDDFTVFDQPDPEGTGELFLEWAVTSPWWRGVKPDAATLQEMNRDERVLAPFRFTEGEPERVGLRLFDMPVMEGETDLELQIEGFETDCDAYWRIREQCAGPEDDTSIGALVRTLPLEDGTIQLEGDAWQAQVSIRVHPMW